MTTTLLSPSKIAGRIDAPLLIEKSPELKSYDDLKEFLKTEWFFIKALLNEHGGIYFRGFGVEHQDRLLDLVSLNGTPLNYINGNSPRKKLNKSVYTSTEYPGEYFISYHNELSYMDQWPEHLFFCCHTPSTTLGETTLLNSHTLYKSIPTSITDKFEDKKITYYRNLHSGKGPGPSWQEVFESEDPIAVARFCEKHDTEFHWGPNASLTLIQTRPAIVEHPVTGEKLWFNQADQFHPSNHPKPVYEALMAQYGSNPEKMPHYATFGDGTPLVKKELDIIRVVSRKIAFFEKWQQGDLLIIDNMKMAHGRNKFTGDRKVLVAMT